VELWIERVAGPRFRKPGIGRYCASVSLSELVGVREFTGRLVRRGSRVDGLGAATPGAVAVGVELRARNMQVGTLRRPRKAARHEGR
jgi:hypothetical protein